MQSKRQQTNKNDIRISFEQNVRHKLDISVTGVSFTDGVKSEFYFMKKLCVKNKFKKMCLVLFIKVEI